MLERALLVSLLALALPAAAADSALRTLFHTADEREQLDRLRRGEPAEKRVEKRGPPVVSGFVKRSDGRDTAWVDGHAVTGPEAQRLADPAKVRESQRADPRAIEIRPSR